MEDGALRVVNVSAVCEVSRSVQLFGRIENLLNEKCEEILLFGSPIPSVVDGVKVMP